MRSAATILLLFASAFGASAQDTPRAQAPAGGPITSGAPSGPQTKKPVNLCIPERGYFVDVKFVARPVTYTPDQIEAAITLGMQQEAARMRDANMRATQPIEMQFGYGTLRINPANFYDQYYDPGPCRLLDRRRGSRADPAN